MTVLLVCGSRSVTDADEARFLVEDADLLFGPLEEVIHGGARGVDRHAHRAARGMGHRVRVFEADWDEHGKAAGPIRNSEMVEEADAVAALWDGESAGTKDTVDKALDAGLDVLVKVVEP